MTAPSDPNPVLGSGDDDESGPYRLADDGDGAAAPRRVEPQPDLSDSEDRDASEAEADSDEGDGSLPPPICRPASAQPWLVVAAICGALLALSWLAGAPQLSMPDGNGVVPELGFGERLNGLARTAVFLPLAMLAAVFGLCALAFVRQRPIGDAGALFAKSLAIVCIASLVWLVPSEVRMVKQALNVIGLPALAGALAVPIFRLHPRDAATATAYGLLGLLLIIGSAWIVVWSTI